MELNSELELKDKSKYNENQDIGAEIEIEKEKEIGSSNTINNSYDNLKLKSEKEK